MISKTVIKPPATELAKVLQDARFPSECAWACVLIKGGSSSPDAEGQSVATICPSSPQYQLESGVVIQRRRRTRKLEKGNLEVLMLFR